jgi:hypothetical protein
MREGGGEWEKKDEVKKKNNREFDWGEGRNGREIEESRRSGG